MKTTNGTKMENPFKNNAEVKKGLAKMFGTNVAEKLTTQDVYKYDQGEPLPFKPTYQETRTRNADGTITVKVIS